MVLGIMDPTEMLKSEHEDIQMVLSILENMAGRMRGKATLPMADLDNAVVILEGYADLCHHAKEEQVLFPELARASPEVGAELARRLKGDHLAFRRLVGTMKELVPRAADEPGRSELAKLFESYVRVLREHIRIEEERLFPEVERSLDPAVRARMAREFNRIEEAKVGPHMHGMYLGMIENLAESYGVGEALGPGGD